ncbi:hypothetical protein [Nonomuraea diastatica]|uniref:Uncharacterized protein n=1 Tax=Nonomuraea diastatica TaxID=1848329 RepID=A0A4R4WX12_9ACTN|nr:hypothetical protein [Nonomuraea diastatica]TDD22261.1 hypothetical protein E1294_12455 [Nonomuraea diastatica]
MERASDKIAFEPQEPDDGFDSIKQEYKKVNAALQSMDDLEAAYQIATQLADGMRQLADAAALARAKSAARICDTEQLSLSGLAARLGVSKARASQLLKAARNSARGEEPEPGHDILASEVEPAPRRHRVVVLDVCDKQNSQVQIVVRHRSA